MNSDVVVLKLKSNKSELSKKVPFSGLLFLSILEAGASAFILAKLQYSYEARFTMSTYLYTLFTKFHSRPLLCRQFIRKIHQ